ncbi:hypothetical protein AAG906_026662 [Vitis piasezkii]
MVQCVTNEGLPLVNQAIDAANNQVQYLDPSFFNPLQKVHDLQKDYNEQLLYLPTGLACCCTLKKSYIGLVQEFDVKAEELQSKQAQAYEIYDLKPFFSSTQLSGACFKLDVEWGVMRHCLAR